jgi:hypothetical protein
MGKDRRVLDRGCRRCSRGLRQRDVRKQPAALLHCYGAGCLRRGGGREHPYQHGLFLRRLWRVERPCETRAAAFTIGASRDGPHAGPAERASPTTAATPAQKSVFEMIPARPRPNVPALISSAAGNETMTTKAHARSLSPDVTAVLPEPAIEYASAAPTVMSRKKTAPSAALAAVAAAPWPLLGRCPLAEEFGQGLHRGVARARVAPSKNSDRAEQDPDSCQPTRRKVTPLTSLAGAAAEAAERWLGVCDAVLGRLPPPA